MPTGLQINKRQCQTCIFGNCSPISPERFAELQASWVAGDAIQICHESTLQSGNVGCRGHYEGARQDKIPHPLQGIWAGLGLTGVKTAVLMQISERMGLVQFVAVDRRET